jgi:hypothetical protein
MKEKTLPVKRYTAAEADVIKQVRDDFKKSKDSIGNNSFWGVPIDSRWDKQEKIAIGYSEPSKQDEFESNVKSPMSTGRIETTMHKLRKLDLQFVIRPDDIKDPKEKRKARVVQELVNNLFQRRGFKSHLMHWFEDCLIHGSAFLHVTYLRKKRTVLMPVDDVKKMSEEQKEKLKNKEKVYKEETIYDYDDIAIEPVKIQEIFVDPAARNIHDTSYEAQWMIRRMLPSLAQFKAMYKGDPDAKNISKVRGASSYIGETVEFFQPPSDINGDDTVELLHYYNKAEDKYIVIANDVVIKDMPLPYKHKQLPFVKINAWDVLHQFWGMGIPDKLMNIQSETEILKNLVYDRLHITANPIIKVKKTIYGEFSKAYQTAEPGLMLPVNEMSDVQTLDYQAMNFDMFRGIESLERDAVLATQIDPIQMGVNQKYVSATTSMLTKEQMDTYITALIDNWTEALNVVGKQCISLMSQFYTVPRVEAAGKVAKNKKVRLTDIEINPDTLQTVEKRGRYTYLEIKPDFFNINGDWEVEVNPESVEVQSKAIEMQKSQAALAQLAPFMIDPSNPQAALMNPQGWVDGPKTIEWYLETNSIPHELLAITTEDEDISIERAELQGRLLLEEDVPGVPGEPEAHKRVHVMQLAVINSEKKKIEREVDEFMQERLGMVPPGEGMAGEDEQMIEMILETEIGQDLKRLDEVANRYADHLDKDNQPKVLGGMLAVQDSKPQEQQPDVPMPPGLTPAGGQGPMAMPGEQAPVPAGGNQQSGMVPQGRPPMAA